MGLVEGTPRQRSARATSLRVGSGARYAWITARSLLIPYRSPRRRAGRRERVMAVNLLSRAQPSGIRREREIELNVAKDREFEPRFLQRSVYCEPPPGSDGASSTKPHRDY